ncbi:Hic1 [Phodopus roborovskii]|uniref:Hypermethylated in cancer 1 protein n=1 Tax=Phodopus roborovskii TaxID=109678 RepID=A0AAU9YZL6_PHORO|nr:Hic1 [Phodopus roborovskii]
MGLPGPISGSPGGHIWNHELADLQLSSASVSLKPRCAPEVAARPYTIPRGREVAPWLRQHATRTRGGRTGRTDRPGARRAEGSALQPRPPWIRRQPGPGLPTCPPGECAGQTMLDTMEAPGHSRQLLLQLNNQRTKGFLCDVIIVVQNALFRAHKNVLAASSAYLKSLVVHDNLLNLDHDMVSPAVFRLVLDFIYTGRLTDSVEAAAAAVAPGAEPSLGAVLAAASYLQIPDLVALCKKRLKRHGKYCHLRGGSSGGGGYAPYGRPGRGLRAATPVIQACYSSPAGPPPPPAAEPPSGPEASVNTHCAELYASAPGPAASLCAPERRCSPLCGLDLSKKSPPGSSVPERPLSERELPPRPDSSPGVGSAVYKEPPLALPPLPPLPFQKLEEAVPTPDPFRGSGGSPGPEPPGRPDGSSLLYRWMKHEPGLGSYGDDLVRDRGSPGERLEERGGDPAASPGGPPLGLVPPPRYPGSLDGPGTGADGDDYKSSSEETGSSEDPSPPSGHLEGYPCPHLAYGEPESFGDNLYVCIPCGKGFPSSEQLNAHVEAHVEEEEALYGRAEAAEVAAGAAGLGAPFGGGGDKIAGAPGGLGELLRPYRCASCDKSYKDPATLRQHEKTHWLTRPYPCTICGKKFTQRGTMTRHMRSHLGLKPFACDACGMRFTRQYRLTEHMRIHSGEKPYECQVCGGKFAQQRNLISHMKMHAVGGAAGAAGALAGLGGLPGVAGPDGKGKLDFPEGVFAVARLTAEQLSLKQQDKAAAAELLAQTTHFLHDPKVALESLYPLAKFTAELGLSPDKAAEVLSQGAHLAAGPDGRTIDRFSPT